MRSILTVVFFITVMVCLAQRPYRGIVVDSATMINMPDVHITIRNSTKGVVTNAMGGFLIYAQPSDTLIFTALGYAPLQLPLLFEEDAIMVLLREIVQVLPEMTIRATRLYPNTIENRTHSAPRTMESFSAVTSPFEYFSRREKEKRRLTRLVEENNRTQTYVQVITDPDVKKILTEAFELTDEQYYDRVVEFNQKNMAVQYFTDPDKIMEALYAFFSRSIGH